MSTADTVPQIGTYIGQSTFIVGFAGLAGTPISGALINTYGGFKQAIVFSGVVMMVGAVTISGARYFFAKDKLIA